MLPLLTQMSRLTVKRFAQISVARKISLQNALNFQTTPCLLAEPLKKKKKIDPQILRQKEERKKKKIEKQIRRLEKLARQLKPIQECEVPFTLIDEKERRTRSVTVPPDVAEQRVLLQKQWAKYKHEANVADMQMIDRIVFSQQKALDELRKESEDLYQEAIQIDPGLLPYDSKGPVATPPLKDYIAQDGDYTDVSRKWD